MLRCKRPNLESISAEKSKLQQDDIGENNIYTYEFMQHCFI